MTNADGTLTDTGPLFALADQQGQPIQNARCEALLSTLPSPLVTTWPCLAETLYMCGRDGGWRMQRTIALLIQNGSLRIHTPNAAETARILTLMEQYQDRPMDLADASLIALAAAREIAANLVFFAVTPPAVLPIIDMSDTPIAARQRQTWGNAGTQS